MLKTKYYICTGNKRFEGNQQHRIHLLQEHSLEECVVDTLLYEWNSIRSRPIVHTINKTINNYEKCEEENSINETFDDKISDIGSQVEYLNSQGIDDKEDVDLTPDQR